MDTKSLSRVQIKDADKGIVTLSFSTFEEIDKDGDVSSKSTFTDGAPLVVSAYGHKSWDGELPLGLGQIVVKDNEATADVRFLMETTHGRDAFLTIKALSEADLQEWSYSLEDIVSERGKFNGKDVRFLNKVTVKEVSPVLRGAGNSTRTLAVKSNKFSEQTDIALRGVKELVEMAVDRLTVRAAEGKSITEQTEAHDQLLAALAPLKTAIDATQPTPIADTEPDEVTRLWLDHVASTLSGAFP